MGSLMRRAYLVKLEPGLGLILESTRRSLRVLILDFGISWRTSVLCKRRFGQGDVLLKSFLVVQGSFDKWFCSYLVKRDGPAMSSSTSEVDRAFSLL